MITKTVDYIANKDGTATCTEVVTDGVNSRTTITLIAANQVAQEQIKWQNQQVSLQAQLDNVTNTLAKLVPVVLLATSIQTTQQDLNTV